MDDEPLLVERLHLQEGAVQRRRTPWSARCCAIRQPMPCSTGCATLAPLGLYAGASLTDRLLTVRFLSDDNLVCQQVMRDVWQFRALISPANPPYFESGWT